MSKMGKVLCTGGCGFIGTNMCEVLVDRGYEVVALDNLSRRGVHKNKEYLEKMYKDKFKFVWGDVRNTEDLDREIKDEIGAIVHLAANPGIPRSIVNPIYDFKENALGTLNMLEFARTRQVKAFIYASTNKVYSDGVNQIALIERKKRYDIAAGLFEKVYFEGATEKGFTEDFAIDGVGAFPHSPYGCSKYVGDIYCQEYYHGFKVPTVVNRMSCIYGKYQHGVEDQGWLSWFCLAKIQNKPLNIFGNGKQVRDCLFGRDVAELYEEEIRNIDTNAGQVYNVGGGIHNSVSLLQVIDHLNFKDGRKLDLEFKDWRLADHKLYISDISKLEARGWKPKTSIWDGIDILHKHIQDNIELYND